MTAITQRQYEASRAEDLRISWAVRNLATYIAGGYMTEGENKAVDIAQTISLDPVEQEFLEKAVPLMEMAPVEPKKGSTEKLLGLFSQTRS